MRVLIVTHYFPEHGSGIEIAAHQLAKRLVSRGFAVKWIASQNTGGGPSEAEGARPERAWNITERKLGVPYPVWSPLAFSRLSQAIRQCDVLHLHDTLYMGNILAFAAARRAHKPVLVTQHIGVVPYRNRVLAATMEIANRLVAASVLKRSSATVVYSSITQNYFSRLLPASFRFSWISNGVDACFHPVDEAERQLRRRQFGWPNDSAVFFFSGRFVEKKGVRILRGLAERFPNHLWVMAGSGPEKPEQWRLPNVRVVGQRTQSELVRFYQAADLLVLPSVGEGFPLVVQESMACGTPVAIATETAEAQPGVAEVAWSAAPDVDSFAALLQSILNRPSMLHRRRESVAAFARREWNWEVCADRYAELLRDIGRPSHLTRATSRLVGAEA